MRQVAAVDDRTCALFRAATEKNPPPRKTGQMSRGKPGPSPAPAGVEPEPRSWTKPADDGVAASFDTARIAEEIAMEALGMAKWARAAGMPTLGFLLESAALEAGAQLAALQWSQDASKG